MSFNVGVNYSNGSILTTSFTDIYTVPTGVVKSVITQARVVNYSASAATLAIEILQNGEATATNFRAVDDVSIPAHSTVLLSEIIGDSLNTGGKVTALSSAATSLSISMTGTDQT
jgi:hypothetical protein